MRVNVLLFGVLKDRLGGRERALELTEGATVAEVLSWVRGELRNDSLAWSIAVAVNREYAEGGTGLREGDEVALLPPVSGGIGEPVRIATGSRLTSG